MTIHTGDVVKWCNEYDGPKHHALLSDPPYNLDSIQKRFGKKNSKPAKRGRDGAFQRSSKGFMGANWDTDIAFNPETWDAFKKVLLPGAFGIAFSSTRTYHRLAVAIEEAGFIIHPMIVWAFRCLSDDTEILTRDGWSHYSKATKGTEVVCYNMDLDTLEWHPVQELHVYEHSDTAYNIRSDHTDQIVTRGHRCIIERCGKYIFQQAETLQSEESVPILGSMSELRKAIRRRKQRPILQKKLLFSRVLWKSYKGVEDREMQRYDRSKYDSHKMCGMWKRKMETRFMGEENHWGANLLEQMQGCLTRQENVWSATTQYARTKREKTGNWNVWPKESILEGRSDLLQETWQLQGSQICQMSKGVHRHGSVGWIRNGTQNSSRPADWEAAITRGDNPSQGPQSSQQRAEQSATICKQQGSQTVRASRIATSDLATVTPIFYEGKVWCVTVPTGAFVARRNGKIFITGNSGFPKPTRVDTQIDESLGVKVDHGKEFNYKGNVIYGKYADRTDVNYKAQTPLAKAFKGHRYGLQAMKPACEPACVFQMPYPQKKEPFRSISETGAGALNLEAAWIDTGDAYRRNNKEGQNGAFNASGGSIESDGGRWPANLILDESYIEHAASHGLLDFDMFYQTNWMLERLEDSDPVIFRAKASIAEREAGLDAMQRRIIVGDDDLEDLEGTVNDGRSAASDRPYLRNQSVRRDIHPTIKPLDLCLYLATLLLPPQGVMLDDGTCDDRYLPRRLFVPFAGVGSEMIGASIAGWEEVNGVELEEKHARIAQVRIDYWSGLESVLGADVLKRARISTKLKRTTDTPEDDPQLVMF